MTDQPEIKPCPFCGADVVLDYSLRGIYFIRCPMCHAKSLECYSEEHAVVWWNRRSEPIGNPEELPEWFIQQLKSQLSYAEDEHSNATYGAPMIAKHIRLLKWVLSLKKPEEPL